MGWGCVVVLLAVLLGGCGTNDVGAGGGGDIPVPPDTGNEVTGMLSLGASDTLLTSTTLPASGNLVVRKADSTLNGLTLAADPGVFPAGTAFTVRSQPIISHSYGSAVQPISPLITVDNNAVAPEGLLQISIPISLPVGFTVLALAYNRATGKLQVLTPLAQTNTALTVAVAHLVPPMAMGMTATTSGLDLFVVQVPTLPDAIDSGFRPGVDNWQFANDGTTPTPGGQCLGNCISEAFYYVARKPVQQRALYNRYDNSSGTTPTPTFWNDDTLGLRLAAAAHRSQGQEWSQYLRQAGDHFGSQAALLNWQACRYGLFLSRQPQLLSLYDAANRQHAVLVYRCTAHALYFADPYYPMNVVRMTTFAGANFTAYDGYTGFMFLSQHVIDWPAVQALWAALDAGTVGTDLFPATRIEWRNPGGAWHNLTNGSAQPLGSSTELRAVVTGYANPGWKVYRSDGTALDATAVTGASHHTYSITTTTVLGVNALTPGLDAGWAWANFHWITVSPMTTFTVSGAASVAAGDSIILTVGGRDARGDAVTGDDMNVAWNCSDTAVATVELTGTTATVTGVTAGTVTITANEAVSGKSAQQVVTVK
jgi:hypothetical protein